ncbi:hypothetical protein UPYG_G00195190 [Umbra pygmaea]|uniref:Interleukin n=1 Tax=Umbra pygmaea TaxID=75934 RepID=A0ABD0WM34_UMBPY
MLSGHYTDSHLFVLFLFFNAMIIKQAYGHVTIEMISDLRKISKDKKMVSLDSRLYTPTASDYQNCSRSTLECFSKEVDVLFSESNDPVDKSYSRLSLKLKQLAFKVQNKDKTCPHCEVYEEQPPKVFISTLTKIVQELNNSKSQNQGSKRKRERVRQL